MREVKDISVGSACFLVKDHELLKGHESEIAQWLNSEGFESCKGWWTGVDWVYININSKTYMGGMPGIPVTTPIGEHAITFDEFKAIYHIFKQYEGKSVLTIITCAMERL